MTPIGLSDICLTERPLQYVSISKKKSVKGQSDAELSDGSAKTRKTQVTFKFFIGEVVRHIRDSSHHRFCYRQFSTKSEPELQIHELLILIHPVLSAEYEPLKFKFR